MFKPTRVLPDHYTDEVFREFDIELSTSGFDPHFVFKERLVFFSAIQPGEYWGESAVQLLDNYLLKLEEMARCRVSKHSVSYWLHVTRRAKCNFVVAGAKTGFYWSGPRSALDACIAKFGHFSNDNAFRSEGNAAIESVLRGKILQPSTRNEKIRKTYDPNAKGGVLTDFGIEDYRDVVEVIILAGEIAGVARQRWDISKGAVLIVGGKAPVVQSNEPLAKSINAYYSRSANTFATRKGVVWTPYDKGKDFVLLGCYFNDRQKSIAESMVPGVPDEIFDEVYFDNSWVPYPIGNLYRPLNYWVLHKNYCKGFLTKWGVNLQSVLFVHALLCTRVALFLHEKKHSLFFTAIEGPLEKSEIIESFIKTTPKWIAFLGLPFDKSDIDIKAGLDFWTLTAEKQEHISLLTTGPHYPLLSTHGEKVYIDYSYLQECLRDLFFGVECSDQNFKGDALEELVNRFPSVLPTKPCIFNDSEKKQFDYSFEHRDTLFIVECKAKEHSLGLVKGDIKSTMQRLEWLGSVVQEVDEKAEWLAKRPIGRNYSAAKYKKIIGIVVTPFIEYIPIQYPCWWLSEEMPRLISPAELFDLLTNKTLLDKIAVTCTGTHCIAPKAGQTATP